MRGIVHQAANLTEYRVETGLPSVTCTVFKGDNRAVIADLPDDSVDLAVTSPPYFQQRSYSSAARLGNETSMEEYLDNIIQTFQSVIRLLKPSGSIAYNMGDKYLNGSLLLVPYRFAIRVTDELGLRLVNDITWIKRNPVPHQFSRRLTQARSPSFTSS